MSMIIYEASLLGKWVTETGVDSHVTSDCSTVLADKL